MCEKKQFQYNWEKKFGSGVGGQGRSGHHKHRFFFLGLSQGCGNSKILYLPRIMYLSEESFTYPKEQIMHKQLTCSLALTVLI